MPPGPQQGAQPLWWRLRCDPEQIAQRDGIPDTAALKAVRHAAQRIAHYEYLIDRGSDLVRKEAVEGGEVYIDARTGEVLAVIPQQPAAEEGARQVLRDGWPPRRLSRS